MKKDYQLRSSDIIVNTLIAVGEIENRRIIDMQDIFNYEEILKTKYAKQKIIFAEEKIKNEEDIKDYIYTVGDGLDKKYGVLPWVSSSELYNSRLRLPFHLCVAICDLSIPLKMKKRNDADIERLNKINNQVVDHYLATFQDSKEDIDNITNNRIQLCKLYNRR